MNDVTQKNHFPPPWTKVTQKSLIHVVDLPPSIAKNHSTQTSLIATKIFKNTSPGIFKGGVFLVTFGPPPPLKYPDGFSTKNSLKMDFAKKIKKKHFFQNLNQSAPQKHNQGVLHQFLTPKRQQKRPRHNFSNFEKKLLKLGFRPKMACKALREPE